MSNVETAENKPKPPPRRAPPITKNTKFLAVTQMAERYSVSTDSIWRWTRAGRLPAPVKINPQVVRWRLEEVEAYDAQHGATA